MPSAPEQDTFNLPAEFQGVELSQQLFDDLLAINLCELEAELGQSEVVRRLATATLPHLKKQLQEHLQEHLRTAKELAQKVKKVE
jgi:hypothetical protein